MWYHALGAPSPVGPGLVALGALALVAGAVVHVGMRWPTILARQPGRDELPPTRAERVSVHLVVYALWAVGFGAVNWRGVPAGLIDVRLPFERAWPVIEAAEWIYFSVYFIPLTMPWLVTRRGALRSFSFRLLVLLAVSVACFLILPWGAPARAFEPVTLAGQLLAWETGRADFAAASLPSFHVFWGLLSASLLATRSRRAGWLGWLWAGAVSVSCVANGAHAIADVAASLVIYAALAALDAAFFRPRARPMMMPAITPSTMPPSPK